MLAPTLEYLPVLVAFAESRNLVEAAKKLRISQPAVTQRLQRLEEQSPLPLFAFEGRKKVLTHYGRAFYELTRDSLAQYERSLEHLHRRYGSGDGLSLRVGCRKELFEVFSRAVQFAGRVEYGKMAAPQALAALGRDEIDVALTEEFVDSPELACRKVFEGSCRIVFHPKVLPGVRSMGDLTRDKKRLLSAPCVLHKTETAFHDRFASGLGLDAARFNRKALVEDWASLEALVENGTGYAIIPAFVTCHSKKVETLEIPHALIPLSAYYAVFPRKLTKIPVFQKALSFSVRST